MISIFYRKLILIILFSYLLFVHIKDKDYSKMILLSILTGVISYSMDQNLYEGVDNSKEFTEEEEEDRRQEWLSEIDDEGDEGSDEGGEGDEGDDGSGDDGSGDDGSGDDGSDGDGSDGDGSDGDGSDGSGDGSGTTCPNNFDCSNHINDLDTNPSSISCASSVCTEQECCTFSPVPSNTPFVSAEYVKLRERERANTLLVTETKDTPGGVGATDPNPSSSKEDFVEKEEVKLTPVQNNFRIGPYDGLCVSSDKLTNETYVPNSDLVTYFGVHGPTQVRSSQDVLTGPTIDGDSNSPQKLSMFANNKTKFNCCGESPYTSSTGCLCLTEKQKDYIRSRGMNKSSPDI